MASLALGSIVSRSHLPYATVLAESLRRFHPDVRLHVLVPDDADAPAHDEPFDRLQLSDLDYPGLHEFLFRYECKQVVVALKPAILNHLLDRGHNSVVYIDADALAMGDLTPYFDEVRSHALTLTPHFRGVRFDVERFRRENQLLMAGIYNAGVIGASDRPEARTFLRWWERRLRDWCICDTRRGLHDDQRWLDMAPAFVGDLHMSRDNGVNLAYWNLPDVAFELGDTPAELRVDGEPCRLFHFSGFDVGEPTRLTRFVDGATTALAPLTEHYGRLLVAAGLRDTIDLPWRWDVFSNGVPIAPCLRAIYAEFPSARRFGDPFDVQAPDSFLGWLREVVLPARDAEQAAVTRLWQLIYDRHPDVQLRFPDIEGGDRAPFAEWADSDGLARFELAPEFALG